MRNSNSCAPPTFDSITSIATTYQKKNSHTTVTLSSSTTPQVQPRPTPSHTERKNAARSGHHQRAANQHHAHAHQNQPRTAHCRRPMPSKSSSEKHPIHNPGSQRCLGPAQPTAAHLHLRDGVHEKVVRLNVHLGRPRLRYSALRAAQQSHPRDAGAPRSPEERGHDAASA